jgi:hypothetical protein
VRQINIEEGLQISFPGRDASFCEGVEIGMLAALMAMGQPEIVRPIAAVTLEQAGVLARKLGYHVAEAEVHGDTVTLVLRNHRPSPKLRLISSR